MGKSKRSKIMDAISRKLRDEQKGQKLGVLQYNEGDAPVNY